MIRTLLVVEWSNRCSCAWVMVGLWRLSFRGATTRPLAWDSSSATVRAALLELPTLRGSAGDEAFGDQREMLPRPLNAQLTGRAVSVLYDNGATTLCAASGVTAIIQFNQDFGDIPLLVPDATDLTHLLNYHLALV